MRRILPVTRWSRAGMGTNGTAGAQAIKAVGGLCIAQDPDGAEFPGMARSLIHAGYADQVLNPADMPALLARYAQHPYLELDPQGKAGAAREIERHRRQLGEIVSIVRARTGHDFSQYKVSRMASGRLRLEKRDTLLTPAIGAAIDVIRPLAESRRIALDVSLSPNIGTVCVDPDRIQQIVWNLLANAVKRSRRRAGA